ncbi:protein NRT1/ PTR FAMILY 5.10-like isoform X2 [Prosopis cineraria]|uniref:protein NRT1/ PTR FAMILY 5.10-like isoform X2 n=1 Tax=Prosopis cineraria TaxID=364024 RepID=UPI00240FC542|nr:protein NRT1/ PTR FAMILY 5.10-like isoform X2 [Prosopis cineraria]XP_054794690.1 protein NRT1/ PTR FAMILY 5.10-like isoform X2 [Prosopis cineraria]
MVEYACLSIIVTFYAKVAMKTHLAEAAMLVCVQEGLASFAAIVLARFTGERSGRRFYTIVFSTGSYITGVVILWSYSRQKPEHQEKNVPLFLVVSCLFAVGKGGADLVLKSFLEHDLSKSYAERTSLNREETTRAKIYKNIWLQSAWIVGANVAIFGFLGLKWPQVLEVSLIVTISSGLLFLFGSSGTGPMGHSVHKDAATVPKRVRHVKWLLMFSCIAYSLVLATGNIFFQEQGTKMEPLMIKGKEVRFSFMIVIKSAVNEITILIFWLCGANENKGMTLVRIGGGMVCAVICCVIAWKVEIERKKVVNDKDPNKTSVAWLSPQYVLLGLVEGLAQSGLEELVGSDDDDENQRLRNPGKLSKDIVSCFGKFLGIPCIVIVRSWFHNFDKDQSHLDRK